MKAYTNALFLTAVLLLIAACTAMAQTPPTHPDPTAVYLGSFTVTVTISAGTLQSRSSGAGLNSASAAEGECQIKAGVSVWRLANGQIDYILDASSVQFVGDCGAIDLSPSDVFALLAKEALVQGIAMNYSPCTPNCDDQQTSRAYSALCVRSVGTDHPYIPCDMTSLCYREFTYCCPNGTSSPTVTEVPRQGEGCGAGAPGPCQPTCGGSSGYLMQ